MKKVFVIFAFVLLSGFIVSAQLDDSAQNIVDQADKAQDIIDNEKWTFIGEQWKEILIANKFIGTINTFFEKIDWFFIILFSRSWSLSVEMFFVFLLWLFTALSLYNYAGWFDEGWKKEIFAFGGTVALAHMQLFNYVSMAIYRAIFYSQSGIWSFVTFIAIVLLLFFYLYFNKKIAKRIWFAKERNKRRGLEFKVKKIEAAQEGEDKASS